MEVKINNRDSIQLKKSMRSYIMFESINDGKPFNIANITDTITFFYCVVCASDKDAEIDFSEFMEWLDENEDELTNFTKWWAEVNQIEAGQTAKKKTTPKTKKN